MLMTNIYQAKTQFSKLIEMALSGQEVVISRARKPVAKLIAYFPEVKQRFPGRLKGKISISDDFTAQSREINKLFYGG